MVRVYDPGMSQQDAAIADLLANHRSTAELILDGLVPSRKGCLIWTGPTAGAGFGAFRHQYQGVHMSILVHRLAYAYHRGVEHLPPSIDRGNRNLPVVARTCRDPLCAASGHLARMRRRDMTYDPFYPTGDLLPDEARFRAENMRRQGIVPGQRTQTVVDLDSDPHSALLLELRLLDPEVARGRFAAAERQVAQAATA